MLSGNKYEKILDERREHRPQKEKHMPAMTVKHDLLLNMEKIMSKCEMWHSYTGWISGYKWLQCIHGVQRAACGLQFMCVSILVQTHREHWSARGLPTESHNWQTLQRLLQTRFWQLLQWGLLRGPEVHKTDFTLIYVKYIPPCHIIIKCTVFYEVFITHHQHKNLLYVGHLESKERLRIQPAQLFHFSWWVMWCVQ